MELAMVACLAALLMRHGCDGLERRRRERIVRELDWVAEGIDLEALLDD